MRLTIGALRTFDLPDELGVPEDLEHFFLYVECDISEDGPDGSGETFEFTVCSPDRVCPAGSGFVGPTLVLPRFSWEAVRGHIETLLEPLHAKEWAQQYCEIAHRLYPHDLYWLFLRTGVTGRRR